MLIFTLRREARISGEAASLALLQELLAELGMACETVPEEGLVASPVVAVARRYARLEQVARTNDTDLLLIKIPTAAQLPLAIRATRLFRGRVVFWIDGLMWRPLAWGLMLRLFSAEPLLTIARAILNNRAWMRASRNASLELIVASQTQRAELIHSLHAAQIHVVPNGSPTDPAPSEIAPAAAIAAPSPAPFGYIGHAYLTKGVWDLLAAYRILKDRGMALPLVFALSELGGNRFRAELSRESVEIRGTVDKRSFYASLRALVAPFWTDWGTQTFPNVLLESLAFGVPVITSDLPVCRELFGNDLAIFVRPNDPHGLARTLQEIDRGERALPNADCLREHFEKHFSRKVIRARWREVLSGSASASRPAAP